MVVRIAVSPVLCVVDRSRCDSAANRRSIPLSGIYPSISPRAGELRIVPPPVQLPTLVALPDGGGTWTEQFTARALLRNGLGHPAWFKTDYAHSHLEGQIIQQFAKDTGLSLLDAHRELYDRFDMTMPGFEAWLVDRRPSTRGWYGNLVPPENYGHMSDTLAVENYLESEKNPETWAAVRLAWETHAENIRAMTMRFRLDRKLKRPRG